MLIEEDKEESICKKVGTALLITLVTTIAAEAGRWAFEELKAKFKDKPKEESK